MSFRTKLLSHKPQITEITLMGENYYLKSLSVGELNRQLFEQRQALIVLAQKANIELLSRIQNSLMKHWKNSLNNINFLVQWLHACVMKKVCCYLMRII